MWKLASGVQTRHGTLHSFIVDSMKAPHVFFMDRLSRSSLSLAAAAAKRGAVVVFEPSSKSDQRFLEEALRLVHIVKYADQRLAEFDGLGRSGNSVRLEIQTLVRMGCGFEAGYRRLAFPNGSICRRSTPRYSLTPAEQETGVPPDCSRRLPEQGSAG